MRDMQEYGHIMRYHRERQKLTIKALAERSGVRATTISSIETGAQWGNFRTICLLADALGLTVAQYLTPRRPVGVVERKEAVRVGAEAFYSSFDTRPKEGVIRELAEKVGRDLLANGLAQVEETTVGLGELITVEVIAARRSKK